MAIVVGIDGTGSAVFPGEGRDREYDAAFANSFVRRICNGGPNKMYLRGPVMLGGGLVNAIHTGLTFIRQRRAAGNREPVLLTGYSRGAAGAVSLARSLQQEGINVRALMLFDCVDRQLFVDAEEIPNNVGYVQHVVRDPSTSSRESFNNDAMLYRPPTVYNHYYTFKCTHGGMGGCPWQPGPGQTPNDYVDEGGYDGITTVTYAEDARISRYVWTFCQEFLSTHGFV